MRVSFSRLIVILRAYPRGNAAPLDGPAGGSALLGFSFPVPGFLFTIFILLP